MKLFNTDIVEAKITFVNRCTAKCTTCLMSDVKCNEMFLSWDIFKKIIYEIKKTPEVKKISFFSIGESYLHPEFVPMVEWALGQLDTGTVTTIVTNGSKPLIVPNGISNFYISFNAGTKVTYEKVTGLSFDDVVSNIKTMISSGEYKKAKNVEIHMLVFKENKNEIKHIKKLFRSFGGLKLRLGYKYDNQHGDIDNLSINEKPISRLPCDYVTDKITFYSDGSVILCSHDFEAAVKYGNISFDSLEEIISSNSRLNYFDSHNCGKYSGLCEHCNYNQMTDGAFVYHYLDPIKEICSNVKKMLKKIIYKQSK